MNVLPDNGRAPPNISINPFCILHEYFNSFYQEIHNENTT